MNKPKKITSYSRLAPEIIELVHSTYPHGYRKKLISIKNMEGKAIKVLPLMTEECEYLIKMEDVNIPQVEVKMVYPDLDENDDGDDDDDMDIDDDNDDGLILDDLPDEEE